MERTGIKFLKEWIIAHNRKPLVIRGARQVGKTWLVRHFAESIDKKLIEVNLEKNPKLISVFSPNEPSIIIQRLRSALEATIDPSQCILFIDEIQAAPELFAKLRWFAEDMPELPVIAAGSLLEFILGKHEMSMPVGRISYMYLEPLSFEEFLLAQGRNELVAFLKEFSWHSGIDAFTHEKLIELFKEYLIVGGMPAAVAAWSFNRSIQEVAQVHHDIMHTYRDDFGKYGTPRILASQLNEILTAVPKHLGKKFVYSKVNPDIRIAIIKEGLELLCQAKVCHQVKASAANGVPLGAELLSHYIKVIMLDVGLSSAELGLSLSYLESITELDLINKGGITEQVVGQLLRTLNPFYQEPVLYYWLNPKKEASAEIDYVIQYRNNIIPIEVKAGAAGSLKSLHQFMNLKELPKAVRIYSGMPLISDIKVKNAQGTLTQYQLCSLPFYLISELYRLIE